LRPARWRAAMSPRKVLPPQSSRQSADSVFSDAVPPAAATAIPRLNTPNHDPGFLEQNFHHAELLVVVGAGVLTHTFLGDHHLYDSCLHHGARAVHAAHDLHIDGAALGGRARARRIADGVALGMLDP